MTWKRWQLVRLRAASLMVVKHREEGEPPITNWFDGQLLKRYKFTSLQDWQVDFEPSEMRGEIGLSKYLDPGDDNLAPEELGRRIDECLVDYIENYHGCLIQKGVSPEEYELILGKIDYGMTEDQAYQAFAKSLQRRNLRPASETYLELARRDAMYGRQPRSSRDLGRDFALVHMDYIRKQDSWQIDWNRKTVIKCLADGYLGDPDPVVLQKLIDNSEESPLAWDLLLSIGREAASAGVDPPEGLFTWCVEAINGHPSRPDERPNPPNRPRHLGMRLRDNEIRHTVNLLNLVGMEEIDGSSAVADALRLDRTTVHRIYKHPDLQMPDLAAHAIERLDPSFCFTPREIWPRLEPYFFHITRN